MSDWITWERCPECGRLAAVGWCDPASAEDDGGGSPVEFDCGSGCVLTVGELISVFPSRSCSAPGGAGRLTGSRSRPGGGPGIPDSAHELAYFASPDELAALAGPVLRDELARGDVVVVIAGSAAAEVLRASVDGDASLLVLDHAGFFGGRSTEALAALRRLVDEHAVPPGRGVRVVGEPPFGCTPRQWQEWRRYEAVVNVVLAGLPLRYLCGYDTGRLPVPVLRSGRRSHRHVLTPGGRTANPDYCDPAELLRGLPTLHEPMQAGPPRLDVPDVTDPAGLRHAVARELATLSSHEAADDFLLAVDEMLSNAARHGRPPVRLRLWMSRHRVVCTVGDAGSGPADPFAGYRPAYGDDLARGGMGLWLARRLCDHLDIVNDPAGVTVRLATAL